MSPADTIDSSVARGLRAADALPPVANRLLAALPARQRAAVMARVQPVAFDKGVVLSRPDDPIEWVYFPRSGLISLLVNFEDGTEAEVGLVGREGVLGSSVVLGSTTALVEHLVQAPVEAYRMDAAEFRAEAQADPVLMAHIHRYHHALHAQITQTAACNSRHDLGQRLAKWLLMAHDRVEGDVLPLTQDLLARMLGVHRPTISVAAGRLQEEHLIRYSPGRITILDRDGLERAACECHGASARWSRQFLGPPHARPGSTAAG
jgi:CRP-like cAMP-binding protein